MSALRLPAAELSRRDATEFGKVALLLLSRVIHRLPLGAALALGRGLGRLMPRFSHRHYLRVVADITSAFGETLPPDEITRIADLFYARTGESLVEFLRLPHLTRDDIRRLVHVEGREHIDAALAQGHGVIIVTGHLGNWELSGIVGVALLSKPVTAIARPQMDSALTEFFTRVREAHGLRVVTMSDVRSCIRVLQRNEVLGVVGDVNANVPGAFVQFLGRPAATYTGVATLAMMHGAPILPAFDERLPDHTHLIRIGAPIPVSATGNKQRDVLITTMRVQHTIQQEIRRRPQDWYWLLQRWRTQPANVPNLDRIPMETRDLTPEEAAEVLHWDGAPV